MDDQPDQVMLRVRPSWLPEGDREGILRLMADELALCLADEVSAQSICDDAWEREQAEPTFIGMGLAVPHARPAGLQRAGVYMAYSRSGIPWPHEVAHFIALLVVPVEAPEMHLQLLSRLVRWRHLLTEDATRAMTVTPAALEESLLPAFADLLKVMNTNPLTERIWV